MGVGCSCERNPNNVSDPTNNLISNELEDQLAEFIELDHPLNVNKKYELFFQINSNAIPVLSNQINRKIIYWQGIMKNSQLYFKSELKRISIKADYILRVEGSSQAWGILRALTVKEYDQPTARTLMKAIGLYLVKNTLQLAYDDNQNRYEIPIFCINDPESYKDRENPYKIVNFDEQMIKLDFRCSCLQQDITLTLSNMLTIKEIKQKFKEGIEGDIDDVAQKTARFFFSGQELQNDYKIGNINYGCVIAVYLLNASMYKQ